MADRRIYIDKAQDAFIERLRETEDGIGPFSLKVDVLSFAASYGAMLGLSKKLGDTTKSPIRQDVFETNNYGDLFYLLAVHKTGKASVLGASDEAQDERAQIFEEYAKGGLERMEQESKGSIDLTDYVLSLVAKYRPDKKEEGSGVFPGLDLSDLLDD
jgi:dnd system-associated protein 4